MIAYCVDCAWGYMEYASYYEKLYSYWKHYTEEHEDIITVFLLGNVLDDYKSQLNEEASNQYDLKEASTVFGIEDQELKDAVAVALAASSRQVGDQLNVTR